MPKYFMLWEVDSSKTPIDPKERGAAWTAMLNMIKQDMADGKITDWGSFAGESKGYSVSNQTHEELARSLQRFFPYVTFKVHQVATVDETMALAKWLTG